MLLDATGQEITDAPPPPEAAPSEGLVLNADGSDYAPPPEQAPPAADPPPEAAPAPPPDQGLVLNADGSDAGSAPAPSQGMVLNADGSDLSAPFNTDQAAPPPEASGPKEVKGTEQSPGDLLGQLVGGLQDAFKDGIGGANQRLEDASNTVGGEILNHPTDVLGSAASTAVRILNYPEKLVEQGVASSARNEIQTGQYDNSPLGLVNQGLQYLWGENPGHMSDEDKARILDAYQNGYLADDGTFYEPGDRAAHEAFIQHQPWQRRAFNALTQDPTILAGGVGSLLERGGVKAGELGIEHAPAIGKAAADLIDTGATFGLNKIVPGLFDAAGTVGKKVGILAPSKRTVLQQGADAIGDTLGAHLQALDETGQRAVNAATQVITDRPNRITTLADGADQLAYKAKDGRILGIVDNPRTAPNVIRPMTAADDEKAVRLLAKLPDTSYTKASRPLLNAMMDRGAIWTKLDPGNPAYERYADMMAQRVATWDRPGAMAGLASDWTNRPVADALMNHLNLTNAAGRVLGDGSLMAEREHQAIQDILQRASQGGVNHLDDWARGELDAIARHGFRQPNLDRALAATRQADRLLAMKPEDFWKKPGKDALRALFQTGNYSRNPSELAKYDNLLNLYRDRLGNPTMRAAELNQIADRLEPLLFSRRALTPSQAEQANHLITLLQSEGIRFSRLDELPQAARDAANGWRWPDEHAFGNLTRNLGVAGNPEPSRQIRQIFATDLEQRAGRSLTPEDLANLSEKIPSGGTEKRVADIGEGYQRDLDKLAMWARLRQAGEEIGRSADLELDKTVKRIATLNHNDSPEGVARALKVLAEAEPGDINNLAIRLTQQDYLISQGALTATGKPIVQKGLSAKAMQGLDNYLNFRRSVQLLNPVHGPYYIMQQAVGNALTLALGKPAALPDYLNPLNWKQVYNVLRKGADVPIEDLPRAMQMEAKFGGRMNDVVSATRNEALLGWFHQPNRSPAMRALGKVVAPEWVFRMAASFDANLRAAAYTAFMDPALKKLERDMPAIADAVREGTATGSATFRHIALAKADVDAAIKDAFARHGPFPSQLELRDAIYQAGGGEANATARETFVYADRVARDYWAQMKPLQKLAREEVDRLGFTGGQTNADEALSKFFMFHFWMSRASKLYAVEAAKNPWQLQAWSHAMQAADEQIKLGRPDWQKTWVDFMKTPAGFTVAFDPVSMLGTYFFFADGAAGSPDDHLTRTPLGAFFENGLGSNLMLNPLFHSALYALGWMGTDAQAPDFFGSQKIETEANYALKLAFQQVNGYRSAHGMDPLPMPATFDSKVLINRIATELGGRLPGSQPVNVYNPEQSLEGQVAWIMRTQLEQDNPDLTPDELEEALNLGLADHTTPAYQEALGKVVDAHYAGPLSDKGGIFGVLGYLPRLISPFTMTTSVTERNDYYVRKNTTGKSPMDTATNRAIYAGPQSRALKMANDDYYSGEFLIRQALKEQYPNATPEQLDHLATQAATEPNDPLNQQARQTQAIMDQYKAIKGGTKPTDPTLSGTVRILGYDWNADTLAHVDADQRALLADKWIEEQGYGALKNQYYAAQKAYLADHPDLAGQFALKTYAAQYDGGEDRFIADERANNPNYARYLDELEHDYPAGTDEWRKNALGQGAYLAITGTQDSAFTLKPVEQGKGLVVGLPGNESLASWGLANGNNTDPTFAKRQSTLQDDLGGMNQIVQFLNSYDPSGTSTSQYLYKVATGGGYLNNAAYNAVKAKFGYVLPSSDSEADRYLQYLADGGDGSLDGYFSWSHQQSVDKKLAGGVTIHANLADVKPSDDAKADPTGTNADLAGTLKASGYGFGRDSAGNLQLLAGVAPQAPQTQPQTTTQTSPQPSGGTASGMSVSPTRAATYQMDDGRTGTLPAGIRLVALGPRRGSLMQVQVPGGGTAWVNATDLQRVA